MSRLMSIAAFAAAICLLASALAFATPSTLIWIPSTDIQPAGALHYGQDVYAGSGVKPLHDTGITSGTGRFEYGIDYMMMPTADAAWFNGKVMLTDETPKMPKIVAGVYNVGKEKDGAPNFVYLLGSKTTKAARFHAGVATGRESVLLVDKTQLLLGVDKTINSKWWAAIDYQGGKSAYGATNIGVAYTFNPKTSLILGYDFYNDSAIKDTATLQLDVNF